MSNKDVALVKIFEDINILGASMNNFRANELPSSAEEGWMRDQEEVAKPPYRADGVVLARIS